MIRIGLLSDIHAWWDERYQQYVAECDEIWHASDIGSAEVADRLSAFRLPCAVYGNIDGQDLRQRFPLLNRFTVDGTDILIKHIGGYPGKYAPSIVGTLLVRPLRLFVSGHSHILKVKYDRSLNMLQINPGAAGRYGFHKVRTLVRFCIDVGEFKDLEARMETHPFRKFSPYPSESHVPQNLLRLNWKQNSHQAFSIFHSLLQPMRNRVIGVFSL